MATTTAEFNFIKPDASDNISPAPFNENFDKVESLLKDLMVDYIVAQGTQGIWEYRRWASGIAECWIEEYTVPSITISSNWGTGNIYCGYIASPGQYPFAFKTAPIVIPTFSNRGTSSQASYSFPIWAVPEGTTTTCPRFQGTDPTKGTIKNLKLGIYVKGRWK